MNKKDSLLKEIESAEQHLKNLKEQLTSIQYPEPKDAMPGDVFEDGSIVGYRFQDARSGGILVVAPESQRVMCYEYQQTAHFDRNNSNWFVPSPHQLLLCSRKDIFKSGEGYWSSEPGKYMYVGPEHAEISKNSMRACYDGKANYLCLFRLITFDL